MNARLLLRRSIAGWLAALATTTAVAQVTVSPSPGSLPQPATPSPTGNVVDIDPSVPQVLDEQTLAQAKPAVEAAGRLVAVLDVPLQIEELPVASLRNQIARQSRLTTTPDQVRLNVRVKCGLVGFEDSARGLNGSFSSETFEIPVSSSWSWQGTTRLEIRDKEGAQTSWSYFLSRLHTFTEVTCNLIFTESREYGDSGSSGTVMPMRAALEWMSGSTAYLFKGTIRNGKWIRLWRLWYGEPAPDEGSVLGIPDDGDYHFDSPYHTKETMIDVEPGP